MSDPLGGALHSPVVSIGVPVYNGERFLPRALNSLLDQTLPDLEVVISDNASTDDTRAICEDFARRDQRVRYVLQETNIGAPRNWNAVVHLARGQFFKWASANDYCAPTMLQRCVDVMRADPGVVLCYGKTELVDEDERSLGIYGDDLGFDEAQPSERFERVCTALAMINAQSGVFRLDTLRQTRLDRLYPAGDYALMAELALYGRFHLVPEVLLFRRQSAKTFTSMLTPLQLQRVFDPHAKAPMKFVLARRHVDNLFSISRAPIPLAEKIRAYGIALKLARWDRAKLWGEVMALLKVRRNPE